MAATTNTTTALSSFPKEPPLPPIGQSHFHRLNSLAASTIKSTQQQIFPALPQLSLAPEEQQQQQQQQQLQLSEHQQTSIIIEDVGLTGKLVNVEAQRVMSVLQEAQRKIAIIGLLPDEVDRRVSTVFGAETVALIGEYKILESKYKSLMESKAAEHEIKETARQLRMSTRALCRHFLQNSNLISKLRFLKSTKSSLLQTFESLLQEVKGLVYERLKMSVEEEKAKQDQLSVIIAKEQKTSNDVRLLKEELEKAKKERNFESMFISWLVDELRDIKQQAEDTTKRLESRSKQKEDQEMLQAKDKETSIKQDIERCKEDLKEMIAKNREEEAALRKKKFKVESEVENWIHKYDQDMEEKQGELEDITAIYNEEKAQLDELQERYNDLQKEYEKIMDERKKQQENRIAEEKRLKHMHQCATLIQAIFRGWKLRREIQKKKAGGKGASKKTTPKGETPKKKKK
ncbi:hypothetical protein HK100_008835 [Physocladia obscura]|uniref:Dynein regulatory complex protein 10 n=1 Tax=Physocladia obscura TaxID=109957 RepID=A0AAD5XFD5_9FUNG|nr:hypothetical protein HK100_008835 [Physocladia obscura]